MFLFTIIIIIITREKSKITDGNIRIYRIYFYAIFFLTRNIFFFLTYTKIKLKIMNDINNAIQVT